VDREKMFYYIKI